jgi:adenosylhomocysteine nucleosidase
VRTLVLVAAERREFAGIESHLARLERLRWPLDYCCAGVLEDRRLLLVANGAGKRLAVDALEEVRRRAEMSAVISTGFCGGLDPALGAGEIFVAPEVRGPDSESYSAAVPRCPLPHKSGVLVSQDCIVRTCQDKRRLYELGAHAVDMESAALAGRASAWGLPFYAIRAVTDTAEESFRCDLEGARLPDGRISPGMLLIAALREPATQLPELWHLRRRAKVAAKALGEFLGDCCF